MDINVDINMDINMDINVDISILTLIGLQFSLTYFPAELCSSQSNRPPWKYFVLVRLTILAIKLNISYQTILQ